MANDHIADDRKKVRLIDADAFKMFLEVVRQGYLEEDTFSSDFAAQVIETVQDEYLANAPTVDAIPVVRCKDCVHMKKQFNGRFCDVWCLHNGDGDEGFCNYGERRTDG